MRVGVNRGGDAFLVADQVDLDRGEDNGPAYIEYAGGDKSDERPLQQFYKFGVWLTLPDEAQQEAIDNNATI